MDISSSLIAKGAAGALAASAAVGTGVAAKEGLFNDFFKTNSETVETKGDKELESVLTVEDGRQPTQLPENRESIEGGVVGGSEGPTSTLENRQEQSAVGGINGNQGSGGTVSEIAGNLPPSSGDTNLSTDSQNKDLIKFDKGLIDFLKNDGDIVFEVKKGDEEITENNLTLTNTNPLSLTAKINVDASNTTDLIEKNGAKIGTKGKRETLQKLNGNGTENGTPWIWSCEIKFVTAETALVGKSINDKEKIFDSTEKGLFNLLKKKLSTINGEQDKKEAKDAKEKFIRFCAKKRTNNDDDMKDKETLDDNKLESTITINLKAGAAGNKGNKKDTTKLYPSENDDDKKFKKLFDKAEESSLPSST